MARTILAIPASSAGVEGLFSIASLILTKRRSNLSNKTLNPLICLKNWGVKGVKTLEDDVLELDLDDSSSEYASTEEEEELEEPNPNWDSEDELGTRS